MTIYDLLFLLAVFTTAIALAAVLGFFLTGRTGAAWMVARYLSAGWMAYMVLVISVSTGSTRKILAAGERRCFDDWCIAALKAEFAWPRGVSVKVEISSEALRVVQRENGVRLYLNDEAGHKDAAVSDCGPVPLNAALQPGQSQQTTCHFASSHEPGKDVFLTIGHDDGFPIRWFIVGEEAWFHAATMIHLPLLR